MELARLWQHVHTLSMFGMVLAYTSKNLKELCTELWELQRDVPIEHWVDVVAVLDRGLLLYANEDAD